MCHKPYLASSVDDLGGIVGALVANVLAEGILDRGVVAIYKVILDELDRQ
jgi:hypothetical protein